ncbi:unnamed protein product [Allacma fusca]|uniref:Uncharacterized protein n=1 Tax=Allacma fusca TaxID=39272 RepID=A0A8J2NP49_9HEXA|nr:unnamed protein product [Allacma fusca]
MVSFHYFIIVTLLIPCALGGVNLSCTNEIKLGEICCSGDVYRVGETIWPQESCNIEPKNENLTLLDSAWLAYDCNSQLWETLKFQRDISEEIVDEDEYEKIQTIKLYQRKSMEALEQACTFGEKISNAGNIQFNRFLASMNFTTRFEFVRYSKECNNETLPFSGYYAADGYSDLFHEHLSKCHQEFNSTLGIATCYKFRPSIFTYCRAIGSKNVDSKTQIVKPTQELSKGESLVNRHDFVQAMMILQIGDVFQKTAQNVCRLDAYRKEFADM